MTQFSDDYDNKIYKMSREKGSEYVFKKSHKLASVEDPDIFLGYFSFICENINIDFMRMKSEINTNDPKYQDLVDRYSPIINQIDNIQSKINDCIDKMFDKVTDGSIDMETTMRYVKKFHMTVILLTKDILNEFSIMEDYIKENNLLKKSLPNILKGRDEFNSELERMEEIGESQRYS